MDGLLKRQRFSIGHVCVLSGSVDEDGGEYRLYYLDLDSCCNKAEYTHIHPTFRFDGQRPRAFSLLGSTLYIFEGYKSRGGYHGKSALKLDLSQSLAPNHKFEDLELDTERLREMHYSKFRPRAIPTPDGKKILVFSSKFCGYEEEGDGTHFELYDPNVDSWLKLPGLSPNQFDPTEPWNMEAYCFINDHVFFIQVTSGMFALDLESLDKGWKAIGDPQVPWKSGYFLAINNKFVFISDSIYDAKEVGLSRQVGDPAVGGYPEPLAAVVPQSSFPGYDGDREPRDFKVCMPSITRVHHDDDDEVVRWCVLQSQYALDLEDTNTARLLIDVYDTHLPMLETRNIKSLQLLVDHRDWLVELEFVPVI